MSRHAHILLLITGALIVHSSAKEPAKKATVLDHPQKVYVDKVSKKLYWPLGKPFWVRIAESADSTAKSYLLSDEIDSVKTDSGTRLSGSNLGDKGIRLDVTGKQALRWYNMVTGEKHALRFYSDGDAPKVEAKFQDIPKYVAGGNTFYGKGLTLELSAQDKMSGLDQIYASINGSPYQPYKNTLSFTAEMVYNVSFYAVDNVGNVSVPQTVDFAIDLSAPLTRVNIANAYTAKDGKVTLSKMQNLTLLSHDSLSGVKETFYRFKTNEKFEVYKSAISLKSFQDGEYQISFYSVDNVGNQETPKSFSFVIDNISPVANVSFEGDLFEYKKGQLIISQRTLVKVDARDARTEVGLIEYSINNTAFIPYKSPVPVSTNPGKHLIAVRATDKLGNTSPVTNLSVTLDSKPPQSSFTFNGPMFKNNYIICITPQTKISLSSHDDLSGVKVVQYSFEGDKPNNYVEPFPITKEGSYILKFRGVDKVNNQEEIQMVPVMVDNTPPVLTETFSSPKLTSADTVVSRFQKSTTLFLQATDNASGVAGIWYSIDGKREEKYEKPIRFDKKGKYTVRIRAQDNVGKISEKNLAFAIED